MELKRKQEEEERKKMEEEEKRIQVGDFLWVSRARAQAVREPERVCPSDARPAPLHKVPWQALSLSPLLYLSLSLSLSLCLSLFPHHSISPSLCWRVVSVQWVP